MSRHESRLLIRKQLELQLLQLRPGEPLPPIRTLKKDLGVSLDGLEGVLEEFDREGLIERRPRQGIFKVSDGDVTQMVQVVDVVACGRTGDVRAEGSFTSELVEAFTLEAGHRHQGIRLHQFWLDAGVSDYGALARRSSVKAVVFLGLHTPELTSIFEELHIAWVSLLPQSQFRYRRTIMDGSKVTEIQLRHLWDLGHTRIGYLDRMNPQAPSCTAISRLTSYYQKMAERGLQVQPHWVSNGLFDDATTMESLKQIFSREPYPTALLVRDPHLPAIYRFLESKGLRVGREVSVVGTDDLAAASMVRPKATTVRNPRDVMVTMTFAMLDRILNGENVDEVQEVPVELVVRESTGPAIKVFT
jgi:DNA-binding LacI/PurR family transcriptional regulator